MKIKNIFKFKSSFKAQCLSLSNIQTAHKIKQIITPVDEVEINIPTERNIATNTSVNEILFLNNSIDTANKTY